MTAVFFDPKDYLERDPATARSKVEAERLRREAGQRAKLCEALTQLAAEQGFDAVTAQGVFTRADFGSGTFYKLYPDPEACLAEAFERCARTALGRVEDAAAAEEGDCASRLAAGIRELLDLLSSHPEVARLLAVEILAGDAGCREARQRWLGRFARLLECDQESRSQPQGGWLARMTAGALASLLALGVVESEDLAWVALWPSQAGKAGAAIGAEAGEAPAKKRSSKRRVWAEQRKRVQRARMLAAMIAIVGEKGYKAAHVKDVPKRAGLSWPLFPAHFSGKEDCMLAAFDTAISPIEARVRTAVASAASATGRAEAGLEALVASLVERPSVARLVAVEIRLAGAEGEKRYDEALARLGQLIAGTDATREADAANEMVGMVTAAVAGMIAREVGEGRTAQLEELLPELVFTALAPCLGGESAAARARAVGGS
jgi:AcrR family transcriptional regulator